MWQHEQTNHLYTHKQDDQYDYVYQDNNCIFKHPKLIQNLDVIGRSTHGNNIKYLIFNCGHLGDNRPFGALIFIQEKEIWHRQVLVPWTCEIKAHHGILNIKVILDRDMEIFQNFEININDLHKCRGQPAIIMTLDLHGKMTFCKNENL